MADLDEVTTAAEPDHLVALLALIGLAGAAVLGGLIAATATASNVPAVAGLLLSAAAGWAASAIGRSC